jgi:choline monooxygenase
VANGGAAAPGDGADDRGLEADLDRGVSLPASWYTDPAIAARERDRIFRHSWQYVGRAEQVARAGDYFTAHVGELPVVVVRADDGLRGFVNVCRHRRHEVVRGSGNRKVLQCPYHAWTYGLDGALRAAPRADREPGFRREDLPLLPIPVDTWGPFVFAHPDASAAPLAGLLGELPAIIARSGLDLGGLRLRRRDEWQADANWKVMIENFLECYHCPVQHPGLSAVVDVDPDAYALAVHGWCSSQLAPVRASALDGRGRAPAYDPHGPIAEAQYHFVWPNLTLSINPGQPNLSLDVWMPDGPERTRGVSEHYFAADVPEDDVKAMIEFNRQVGAEDDALTSSVQRGLRAGRPERGRFLPASEALVIHFQKLVLAAVR